MSDSLLAKVGTGEKIDGIRGLIARDATQRRERHKVYLIELGTKCAEDQRRHGSGRKRQFDASGGYVKEGQAAQLLLLPQVYLKKMREVGIGPVHFSKGRDILYLVKDLIEWDQKNGSPSKGGDASQHVYWYRLWLSRPFYPNREEHRTITRRIQRAYLRKGLEAQVTSNDAAFFLGVSEATLDSLVIRGVGPLIRYTENKKHYRIRDLVIWDAICQETGPDTAGECVRMNSTDDQTEWVANPAPAEGVGEYVASQIRKGNITANIKRVIEDYKMEPVFSA